MKGTGLSSAAKQQGKAVSAQGRSSILQYRLHTWLSIVRKLGASSGASRVWCGHCEVLGAGPFNEIQFVHL